MMFFDPERKMRPRHADGVHVILLGRVSTTRQQASNIEAGYEYARPILRMVCEGEPVVRELGDVGSGMRTDRPSIMEVESLIELEWPELILMEDLSKAYRNPRHQLAFVQNCVDAGIRVIAVGDNFDTWDENWEIVLANLVSQHGTHIPATRRRVRRSAVYSFRKGGWVLRVRAGYQKLTKDQAASGQFGPKGHRLMKLPEWASRIESIRLKILQEILPDRNKRLQDVVDWMNDEQFPTGPYCKRKNWTVKLLVAWLRDPILFGWRRYRQTIYGYIYRTGKHKRDKNADPEREYFSELAFMSKEQWEELQRALDEIQAGEANAKGENHPRFRVPRHKSISPRRHMRCLCKSPYYDAGKDCLKCRDASHKPGGCWNHVLVDAERARVALVDTALAVMNRVPIAQTLMLDAAWEEFQRRRTRATSGVQSVDKEIADLQAQASRLAKAIKLGGELDALVLESKAIQKALKTAQKKKERLAVNEADPAMPSSRESLELDPRAGLLQLARTSYAFSDLMRRIFPRFVIQPVQALDSGLVRPRALLELDLGVLLPADDPNPRPAIELFEVDLFDPPEHIKHLAAVVSLKASLQERGEKSSLQVLATKLGIGRMTVRRALEYAKLMAAEGLAKPYRELKMAPANASRWKPKARLRPLRRSA